MPDQLLSGETVEHYRRAVAQGAERVAARLAADRRAVHRRAARAAGGDDRRRSTSTPRSADSGAALDELERIYLRDAVYFHHPRYLAHLNCPVAIPAAAGRDDPRADQLVAGHLGPERRRDADRAAADRLDGGADRPRPRRRRRVHQRRHAVEPAGAAHGARRGWQRRPSERAARARRPRPATSASPRRPRCWACGEDAVIAVPVRRRDADAARPRCARRSPPAARGDLPDGGRRHGRDDRLRQHRPARRDRRRLRATTGVWLHVDAAYGCGLLVSRRRAACSTASSAPTR